MNFIYLRRYFPIAVTGLCFVALYHHVIYKMARDWSIDANYSHGFLIPVISAYLIWQNREVLSRLSKKPANSGLILLAISLGFFIIASIGAELFTQRFSIILVVLSATVFLFGWEITKAVLLPIGYLIFMIPLPTIIWNQIAFPLKLYATKMAVIVIKALSIPVYSEGNIIFLANTTLEVVDACSGLRSLTSLLALSAAFAMISNHSRLKSILLFFSAVPVAIMVNVFRLASTAILARYFGAKVAEGFLHDASGIVVFLLALSLMYLISQLMHCLGKKKHSSDLQ